MKTLENAAEEKGFATVDGYLAYLARCAAPQVVSNASGDMRATRALRLASHDDYCECAACAARSL